VIASAALNDRQVGLTISSGQIFYDRSVTIEDIMREKGQMVRKIRTGKEGDVEFWGDTVSEKES